MFMMGGHPTRISEDHASQYLSSATISLGMEQSMPNQAMASFYIVWHQFQCRFFLVVTNSHGHRHANNSTDVCLFANPEINVGHFLQDNLAQKQERYDLHCHFSPQVIRTHILLAAGAGYGRGRTCVSFFLCGAFEARSRLIAECEEEALTYAPIERL
jgi:hypothetical protein